MYWKPSLVPRMFSSYLLIRILILRCETSFNFTLSNIKLKFISLTILEIKFSIEIILCNLQSYLLCILTAEMQFTKAIWTISHHSCGNMLHNSIKNLCIFYGQFYFPVQCKPQHPSAFLHIEEYKPAPPTVFQLIKLGLLHQQLAYILSCTMHLS